jgi:hypothetical protein
MALCQLSITRVLVEFAGRRVNTPDGQRDLIALDRMQHLGDALLRGAYSNFMDPCIGDRMIGIFGTGIGAVRIKRQSWKDCSEYRDPQSPPFESFMRGYIRLQNWRQILGSCCVSLPE